MVITKTMSGLAPRLTRLPGVPSSLKRPSDDLASLTRAFSALVNVSPRTATRSSTNGERLHTDMLFLPSSAATITATASFHTSVFERLMGNPKSITYDLVPQEPKNPEEWEFRFVRYGKSEKEWRPKIPMGIPDLDAIPEGHVDRTGKPYTTEPLPWNYTRGIDPATKHRSNFKVGEGVRRFYRMLDNTRHVPKGENSPFVERVLDVIEDETRNPYIALVANGNFKRYILATENMKPGDLIKTYNEIPRNPVQAFEGDAYPVGALSVGTVIHNLEKIPGKGGEMATMAGSYGTVLRKEGDRVIISLYKKKKSRALVHNKEVSVDERCMATVGRVSNVNYHLIPIGSATMLRKLGYRSRSGLWQLKDGRFGRRMHPPGPVKVIEEPRRPFIPIYQEK